MPTMPPIFCARLSRGSSRYTASVANSADRDSSAAQQAQQEGLIRLVQQASLAASATGITIAVLKTIQPIMR